MIYKWCCLQNLMMKWLLDEDQNKCNYEDDGIPSTYTRRKLSRPLGLCLKAFRKDRQGFLQLY